MGAFGILARKGLTCLAAILTLIAGAPHFECHCPGGQVKPICFGTAAPSHCCGGGACCRGMSGRGCCCRHQAAHPRCASQAPCRGRDEPSRHPLGSPRDECLAQGRGCVKTLAPRLPLVVPSSPVAGAERLDPVAFVAAVLLPTPARAAGPSEGTSAWAPCHAPPRDQLLRLRRLLI
jgi:hypothetical protein